MAMKRKRVSGKKTSKCSKGQAKSGRCRKTKKRRKFGGNSGGGGGGCFATG